MAVIAAVGLGALAMVIAFCGAAAQGTSLALALVAGWVGGSVTAAIVLLGSVAGDLIRVVRRSR